MNNLIAQIWRMALIIVTGIVLASCLGDDGSAPPASEGSATIGAAGGTVQGPDGVQLVVPPGALADNVTIRIARSSAGAPSLSDIAPKGAPAVYEVTPHGQAFAVPVQLNFPVTGTGDYLAYAAEAGGSWSTVPATVTNGTASISRDSLSWFAVLDPQGIFGCYPSIPYSCSYAIIKSATLDAPAGATAPRNYGVTAVVKPATMTITLNIVAPSPCATGAVLNVYQTQYAPGQNMSTNAPVYFRRPVLTGAAVSLPNVVSQEEVGGTYPFSFNFDATNDGGNHFDFEFACHNKVLDRVATAMAAFSVEIPATSSAPVITQQPANVAVAVGSSATFTVQATALHTLSVDWQRSDNNGITFNSLGVTTPAYTLSSASLADNGALFRAHLCDVGTQQTCVDSANATLTVTAATVAPSFTLQPGDLSIVTGQTASFTVSATGTPAPAISWEVAAAGTTAFAAVTGEAACAPTAAPGAGTQTSSTCTIAQTPVANSGQRYRAVAGNAVAASGVASNFATLNIAAASTAPSITQAPSAQTTTVGGSATFSVSVSGTSPISYAWQISTDNGQTWTPIAGAIASSYTTPAVAAVDDGTQYRAVVSNGAGTVTSAAAILHVNTTCTGANGTGWCNTGVAASYLRNVAFGSNTLGLATSYSGALMRTTDAGVTWSPVSTAFTGVGAIPEFYDIAFADANTAIIVGGEAISSTDKIWRSIDGGITWSEVYSSPSGSYYLSEVRFGDANIGLVAAGQSFLRTADGGATWTTVNHGQTFTNGVATYTYSVRSIAFPNSGTILASTSINNYSGTAEMLRSTDGGLTWSPIGSLAGYSQYLWRLSFVNANVGVGVIGAGGSTPPMLGRTTDGGQTWSVLQVGTTVGTFFDSVHMNSDGTGVAVDETGEIARTADAGATWQWVNSGTTKPLYGVASPSSGVYVVVGDQVILRNVQSGVGP
ncbi:YCF48-related protein [Rhodoferax sp.]|uniref:YCF48-related protein n=1 Tax=Rhodoferax sp. TaxID=50421 RepID=UPI0028408011|nr:YCF48-related protein [Rhodoferax sp.]MDR3370964.1 YCF48-related protein [Rhodoferax sp.]